MEPGISNSSRTQRINQPGGGALPSPRLWLLLALALLLVGLTATVVLAGAEPQEQAAMPAWLEPRGIAVTDMIGDIPDEILKDMILSFDGGVGTVQYESGKRTGDTVVVTTTIHSRIVPSSWAPGGKVTNFTCLGQRAFFDHMGTMVPETTLKIYDTAGADITDKIDYLHLYSMGTRQPSAGSGVHARYPQTDYGAFQTFPLPLTPQGLVIPPNSGCRVEITGEDIYPITGVYTFKAPKNIEVKIIGSESFLFHSYVGAGNVGIFGPLMSQMKRRFPKRHEDAMMTVPTDTEFILAKVPAMPGDAYTDIQFGPPYGNADRPSSGTYRLATDVTTLGADLIFSAGFPMANTWRDADQAPGTEFLPEVPYPRLFKSPEYVIPPAMEYHACFTQGDCSGSVLDKVYNTGYDFELYYLEVRRIKAGPTWVPVQLAGPAYRPGILSEAANAVIATGTPEPASANAGINFEPPNLQIGKEIEPLGAMAFSSEVTFTIWVSYTGATIGSVVVTDSLPEETLFARWVVSPAGGTPATVVDNEIQWSGSINNGEIVTLTFIVSQSAGYGQTVTNTAELGGDASKLAEAAFTVETSPTLVIAKEVTPQTDVGYLEPVTYTVVLRNQGPSNAYGVLMTDDLPSQVAFGSWAEPPPIGTTVADDEIQWTGDLMAGKAVTFTWVASQTAAYDEGVSNTAQYRHTTGSGSNSARFLVEPSPTLDLDKLVTPQTDVGYGQPVTYTLVAINSGQSDALDYVLTDTLHALTAFASWVGSSHGASVNGDRIKWTGTVTANDAVTLTFVANQTADYGQTITNSAEFSHGAGSGTATAEFTVIGPPVMQVSKAVTPAVEVEIGSPVIYTILVANPGPTEGFETSLTDNLPVATSFAAWSEQPPGASEANGTVAWSGIVPAGEAVTLTFSVNQSAAPLSVVKNVAAINFPKGSDQAEAAFTTGERPTYEFYLPLVIGWQYVAPPTPTPTPTPIPEVDPPPNSGCPCGWFDHNGRMLDYWAGY